MMRECSTPENGRLPGKTLTGLYYSYIKTRSEQETNQMKQYHKQQEEIAHIKKFIASVS
jgi:ATPase subunit of ABC transporter with duplicated ATPase domains